MKLFVTTAVKIQDYIFNTNKLAHIVGASAIVEKLTTKYLTTELSAVGKYTVLMQAAGCAKILINDDTKAAAFAMKWPYLAAQKAPGLQIHSTLVYVNENLDNLKNAMLKADDNIQIKRNNPWPNLPPAGPLVIRAPHDGLPAVGSEDGDYISEETSAKIEASKDAKSILETKVFGVSLKEKMPLDFSDIAGEQDSYIAVIHADGNKMGEAFTALMNGPNPKDNYIKFSEHVSKQTALALNNTLSLPEFKADNRGILPFRVLVCAGDDITIVLRANLAPKFAEEFAKNFEAKLKSDITSNSELTIALGIAFVKKAFPFYSAYELADSLNFTAKEVSKKECSSVAFWRQTTSLSSEYKDIVKQELTKEISLATGGTDRYILTNKVYSLGKSSALGIQSFSNLNKLVEKLSSKDGDGMPRGPIRKLATAMLETPWNTGVILGRIKEVNPSAAGEVEQCLTSLGIPAKDVWADPITAKEKIDGQEREVKVRTTPLYDAIELQSILGGE